MATGDGKRIIAVGGGKGGVGKTVVASNLAGALAERGVQTVLLDADLGMANVHTLFGLDRPERNLTDFIRREVNDLDELRAATPWRNLTIIPGAGAHPDIANFPYQTKQRLLKAVERIDADVVVLDVGAGSAYNTVDFFVRADVQLVVLTPEITSLQNAYAFQKASAFRMVSSCAQGKSQKALIAECRADRETERLPALIARVAERDHDLSQRMARIVDSVSLGLIGNRFVERQQENTLFAFARMVNHFLGLQGTVMGQIFENDSIRQSVNDRQPFYWRSRADRHATAQRDSLALIADRVLELDVAQMRSWRQSAIDASQPIPTDEEEEGQLLSQLRQYTRRHERFRSAIACEVVWRSETFNAQVHDFSVSGALVVGGCPAALLGERLTLRIGNRSVEVVVRNERSDIGGVGVECIDGADFSFLESGP